MSKLPISSLEFGPAISAFGMGIAQAQTALDKLSMEMARTLAGLDGPPETARPFQTSDGTRYSLLELGFTPAFYHISDAVFDMKIAVTITSETSQSKGKSKTKRSLGLFRKGGPRMTSVEGHYASRYQHSSASSTSVRTKLSSMPTPSVLEERLRQMVRLNNALREENHRGILNA